jgi:hypothetical protein
MTAPIQAIQSAAWQAETSADRALPVSQAEVPASVDSTGLMPSAVSHSLAAFGAMVGRMDASSTVPPTRSPAVEFVPSVTGAATPERSVAGFRPEVGLLLQTFDFSIDTELVSRAVSEFTGSVDALVKTQ